MTSRRTTHFRDGVSRIDFVLVQKTNKSEAMRLQNYRFLDNLKKFGLKIEREKGVKFPEFIFIKLHTPDSVLKSLADIHGVALTFEKDRTIPHYNNRWKIFKTKIMTKPNKQDPMFKRCSESVRGDPTTTFTNAERIMLTYYVLQRTKFGTLQNEFGLLQLLESKNFEDAYPLHDGKWEWENTGPLNDRQVLDKFWAHWKCFYKQQPLHIIYKYYGSEIAFYFAWLEFYTKMLLPLAILGSVIFLYGLLALRVFRFEIARVDEVCASDIDMCPLCVSPTCFLIKLKKFCKEAQVHYLVDNVFTISFAIFTAVWVTVFLEIWQRSEYTLLYRWNLISMMPDIDELPDFKIRTKKYIRRNISTGLEEHYYPLRLQIRQYCISAFFCFLCILSIIITTMFTRVTVYIFQYQMYSSGIDLLIEFTGLIMQIYSALVSIFFMKFYTPQVAKISRKLTDKEPHRTANAYLNSYIFKSYLMSFFNTYTILFYNAFFKHINYTHPGDHEHYDRSYGIAADVCPPTIGCAVGLSIHIIFIMVKNYIIMALMESKIVPILFKKIKNRLQNKFLKKKAQWNKIHLPQWELDYELAKPSEIFFLDSFMSLILEYGMVMFFVASMPLLPFLALFNCIISMRISSRTLVRRIRRNIPKRVRGLGAWKGVLESTTRISFLVSGCVIAFTSGFVHRMTYKNEEGSLRGFVNDTLSIFLIDDFKPTFREVIKQSSPNVSVCFYSGLRNPYNHTAKYQAADRHYKILSLELVALFIFVHVVFALTHIVAIVIPKTPEIITELLSHEEEEYYSKQMKKVEEQVRQLHLNETSN